MSDLSPMDQSFGLSSVSSTMVPMLYDVAPVTGDVQPHEVGFRRLQGPREIAGVLHLRNEIQLPASALGDSSFAAREKKEMKLAWSALSCATANTSAPSACCR
jgi:hypothetical protein